MPLVTLNLRPSDVDLAISSVDPRASSVDPRASSVDLRASSVDPRASSVDPRGSSVDLSQTGLALSRTSGERAQLSIDFAELGVDPRRFTAEHPQFSSDLWQARPYRTSPGPVRATCKDDVLMGAEPYWYFVPYDSDPAAALERLRRREFEAGRYSPVVPFIDFADPIQREAHHGAGHPTIEAAVAEAAETGQGTRSILDIHAMSMEFEAGAAAPFAAEDLVAAFDTERPSRSLVERHMVALLEERDRGQCGYLVVYADERPTELCFAGYSYD